MNKYSRSVLKRSNTTRRNYKPTQIKRGKPILNINREGYYIPRPNPLVTNKNMDSFIFRENSFFRVPKTRKHRRSK